MTLYRKMDHEIYILTNVKFVIIDVLKNTIDFMILKSHTNAQFATGVLPKNIS